MKKLKSIVLSVILMGMLIIPINAVTDEYEQSVGTKEGASSTQEAAKEINSGDSFGSIPAGTDESSVSDSQVDSADKSGNKNTTSIKGRHLSGVKSSNSSLPQRSPAEKNFTLTKISGGVETKINDYDKFSETVSAMDINDVDSLYTIYINRDVTIPKTDHSTYRSNNKIRLTSKNGEHFKLTREGEEDYIAIQTNAELTVDNITLDGNNDGQCLFISNNGKVTVGKGTVIQNFIDSPTYDGPPIYMTGGILNIEADTLFQNNSSNTQGGIIQAHNGTTINIYGGTFKNNKSNKSDGGAIAAYGKLNITGGVFENNVAKKTSGAIIIGAKADATIKNATFKNNQAGTGGAMYSGNNISISDSSFENNQANWGGAIFTGKSIDLTNVTFNENKVNNQGGALYLSSGAPKINNCKFNGNLAKAQGGAIYIKTANATITDSKFTKNESKSGGGAIFVNHNNNGTTKISKTSFADNFSSSFGGGVYLGMNAKLEVTESSFENNQAAYGAGISSAGKGDVAKNLTNIKVEKTNFTGNESLMGAGIFTAFPTEIVSSTFMNNEAIVDKNDEQTNPHLTGVGAAMEIIDNNTVIKWSTFEKNIAGGSGGAIGISGVTRDNQGKITGFKKNIKVEISDNTKFVANLCKAGQGGAIYTIPYLYDLGSQEISDGLLDNFKANAYKNLTTDDTTLFKGNKSETGLFNPPENYKDFANLQFSKDSDVPHHNYMPKSLINNYDINYKSDLLITYDANGGEFSDGAKIKQEVHKMNDNIKIKEAPARPGYKFLYWKGSKHNPGDKYQVVDNHVFLAQWNKAPELEVKDTTINAGDKLDLGTLITKAEDEEDGKNLNRRVAVEKGNFDNNKPGKYTIKFTLTDKNGESVTRMATVTVRAKEETPKVELNNSNKNSPGTGDNSNVKLYILLLGFAVAILVVVGIAKKISKNRKKDK